MQWTTNQTIRGRDNGGKTREWTVVVAYLEAPGQGLVLADPHFTDDERKTVERVSKVNEAKKTVIPHGVHIQRSVLEISDIELVAV